MSWVYFVGFALIAASLSIATKPQVRWSGLLFGAVMFLFVAMLHLPGAVTAGGRIPWTIVVREMSFGGAGWVLAGITMGGDRERLGKGLIAVGRVLVAIVAIFFRRSSHLASAGTARSSTRETDAPVDTRSHLHRLCDGRVSHGGVCFLLARKTRLAATYLGAWIVLLVVVIYGPVLIGALADPSTGVQVEGVDYFAESLPAGETYS